MSTLEKAINIAVLAHAGQTDKDNKPYILHPLRVMLQMETEEEQIVAVLHDVVEDTDVTPTDLQLWGFSKEILEAIYAITCKMGEPNATYITRCKQNKLAKAVKIADVSDNSSFDRMSNLDSETVVRLRKKYILAKEILLS